jgi:hypothetical protein
VDRIENFEFERQGLEMKPWSEGYPNGLEDESGDFLNVLDIPGYFRNLLNYEDFTLKALFIQDL